MVYDNSKKAIKERKKAQRKVFFKPYAEQCSIFF